MANRKKTNYFLLALIGLIIPLCFLVVACGADKMTVKLCEGNIVIRETNVTIGSTYNLGSATKAGYTFLGWYSEQEGGSAYTDAQGDSAGMTWKEENSTTLYAHWEANNYKITFDYCGATTQNSVTDLSITYDAKISSRFPVPQKSGYSFLGWFTDKTNGVQITDSSGNLATEAETYNNSVYPLDSTGTTLYAHWGEKTVTFAFNTDGSKVNQVTYSVGTVLYELPTSIKDNYCFVSWCFDSTNLSSVKFPYIITDDLDDYVNLYAKFEIGSNDILQFNTIASTKDREYEVTYNGNADKIVIPDSYYGKKVTRLNKINSTTVKEIILPQSINEFASSAFEGCKMLEKVNIPTTISKLPDSLFSGCEVLSSIELPYKINSIGKFVFSGCGLISEMYLSENVQTIGTGAFRNMAKLEKIVVEPSNEKYIAHEGVLYYKIGNSTYLVQYPAAKVAETCLIDESTTKILEYAFSGSKIKFIEIGNKISSIEKGAFENCRNLINVTISGNAALFTIGADAFLDCLNLKAMKIDLSKVPTLNATALSGVSDTFSVYVASTMVKRYQTENNWRNISSQIYSLGTIYGDFAIEEVNGGYAIRQYFGADTEVTIPEILNAQKVVKISENAFSFSNIEKITISQNIVAIGDRAFRSCSDLKTIIVECSPPTLGIDVFYGINTDFGIYVKNSMDVLDQYRIAAKWNEMSDHIWSYNNQ